MNYRLRKRNAKLQEWYICKQLGISHMEWVDVTTGRKSLANDKLDKFIQLTEPSNKEYINQNDELEKINEWYLNMDAVDFKRLMDDFKVKQTDIAKKIDYDKATICRTMNKKGTSEGCKCALYYFFNDENNRMHEYKKEKTRVKIDIPKIPTIENKKELDKAVTFTPPSFIDFYKREMSITSFVKKEDYDRVVKEKNEAEEELARYRYLIDLLRIDKTE